MRTFTVEYERDETGWWVATVQGVDGCFTQGRSLELARSRIREALEATLPSLGDFELRDEVRSPPKTKPT